MSTSDFSLRLRILVVLIFLAGIILIGKLYIVTIVKGDQYREAAERQYRRGTGLLFERGSISFTGIDKREVGVATIATGAILAINPSVITDIEAVYTVLNALIPLDKESFVARASQKQETYREIARRVPKDVAMLIEEARIEGTIVSEDRWWTYAGDDLAAQTIGFVGWEGNIQTGRYGLEKYYNHVLYRPETNEKKPIFASLFDTTSPTQDALQDKPGDIVVSIEPSVQLELKKTLSAFQKQWDADEVGAIVMDPQTGSVFAMASLPTFDLNAYSDVSTMGIYSNPLTEKVYEMGSIAKPLTLALGLEDRIINPESTYEDKGFLELDGKVIKNFDGRGRGVVSMQEVLNQSLNTGVSYVALQLGYDRFISGLKAFGIGRETGIDLPNESAGLVSNLNNRRDITIATASYGQGFAVTPIMMTRALATLGNGGVLVNPHLIEEVRYEDGSVRRPDYGSHQNVISKKTSDTITRMLVNTVDTALLHGSVKLPRYHVAAKTGTAQMAKPDGGYYDDRYLHSFFAYFPAYNPKFIIFFYAINPKEAVYASETLAVPAMDTARFLLSYYNIPPDR